MATDEWALAGWAGPRPAGGWVHLRDGPSRASDRRTAGGRRGPERARPVPVGAVSDRARRRRRSVGIRARAARGGARLRGRAARLPAAASLRRGDLRELRRFPGQPPRAHAQHGWAGARDDVRSRLDRARAHPGAALGSRLRPRGDRLADPRRLVSGIEGEGLFNDATALVAYRVAVTAVVAGSFSLADAGLKLALGASGGVAIGLAVGWIVA